MFSTNHLILLAISIIIIISMLVITNKLKLSFDSVLTIMVIVSIASELIKTFSNFITNSNGNTYLDIKDLPLHLCSLQIFFFFALKWFIKKESTKQTLLKFMFPTCLIGAIMALLIPTEGVDFKVAQVYQYFGFHSMLIFFAIYLISFKIITIDFKTIKINYLIFYILAFIMIWINSLLQAYNTNFFFVTNAPMENLPYLNTNNGYIVYFIHLLLLSFVLLAIIQLPFAIINKKKNKGF